MSKKPHLASHGRLARMAAEQDTGPGEAPTGGRPAEDVGGHDAGVERVSLADPGGAEQIGTAADGPAAAALPQPAGEDGFEPASTPVLPVVPSAPADNSRTDAEAESAEAMMGGGDGGRIEPPELAPGAEADPYSSGAEGRDGGDREPGEEPAAAELRNAGPPAAAVQGEDTPHQFLSADGNAPPAAATRVPPSASAFGSGEPIKLPDGFRPMADAPPKDGRGVYLLDDDYRPHHAIWAATRRMIAGVPEVWRGWLHPHNRQPILFEPIGWMEEPAP